MKSKYEKIANKYVKRFLRKQGFFDELNGEYYEYSWGLDGVGGTIEVSDYFISFEDIRTDIDREVEKGVCLEYCDHVTENERNINYKSYLMGAR